MNEKKNMAQNYEDAITRGKLWGTIVMAGVLVLICAYAFSFTLLSAEKTSINSIAKGIFIFVAAANLISIALTLRHRQELGFGLSFSSSLIIVIAGTLLLTGRAPALSIFLLVVSVIGIWWLSSRQSRQWYFIAAAVTLILAWVIEWISPAWRLPVKALPMGPIGAIVFAIIFVAILRIRFWKIASASLRFKITLWSGLLLAGVATILIAYSTLIGRQAAIDAAQKEALSISNAQALSVSEKLDLPLTSARTMAFALKGIKDPVNPISLTREQVNKMLQQLNVENPSFLGTYTLWEPNAFDGLDNQYKNTPANDATGRFIPYWVRRADGSVTVEALLDYETPGVGDWYVLPRQLKKEVVLAPLVYPINGVETVMASFVVPIMQGNTFYGIAGVDAPISFVQGMVDGVNLYNGNANAVLLTSSGTVIGYRSRPELVNKPATEVFADYKDLQPLLEKGEAFISLSPDGKDLRIFSPVEIGNTGTHWYFGLIIPFSEITASATTSAIRQGVIGLVLALLALIILWFLSGQIVRPVTALTKVANAVSQGNLNVTAEVQASDETGVLANAFNLMITQLRESFATLEARVADRTRNLELAGEVGRTVSQVRALDVMLTEAAELIRAQFDLYYVQVYLTNPSRTALILQSGTGTVGAELIGRGHQLPLNTASINGRAATEKRSVVISDTTTSATFKPNPLLPNTRSEMAVPLIIGEKVVGVLDLQSQQAGALTQDILSAFEALAGQLAIAIQNANFLAQVEQARAEIESQARRQTRSNWNEYLDAIHMPEETGFVFQQNKIAPINQTEQYQPSASENVLTAPIAVTGESLGNLVVEMEGQSASASELVNTVAQQVARQIESLRLLDSAERYRFEAEEASRRVTREGWKSYTDANAGENLSFIYDLKEVRPFNQDGDRQTEESATTLPLKVRDEIVGKLVVQGLESKDKDSLEFANAVAERLGAHIESLRQYDQTQSALTQSEKLFEASRLLTQASDLQELVKATVETLNISVVNRAILGIFSYNAAGELESMTDIANWSNGTGTEVAAIGTSYSAKALELLSVFLSDKPLFFNDTFNDERMGTSGLQVAKGLNIRAGAVLPLFLGTRQLGILMLQAEQPYNFSQDEIRLYSALAPQISTVLENRRQFERAQKQAEREGTLNVISQKIQSATTVEAVLQIAARELGHALGAPMTIAQLSMKDKK